ncbi:ankyrin repeat domain-containing protein [Zobellella maritima]|uniref:ankyrin repeat domain-containing protein n=1 Tax=Zobellella maritima TaxID=2059725 RepID=UPI000E306FA7|nr:ankyrin repeat domain-containing protein [Zobellella maritima]
MDPYWQDAIRRGDLEAVLTLLHRGTEVNARDRYGQTGLMLASLAGHGELVSVLIAHGADPDVTAKFGLNALMLAIIAEQPHIAAMLAHAGTDLSRCGSGAPGFAGKTAYDLAVERGMDDLLARLKPI